MFVLAAPIVAIGASTAPLFAVRVDKSLAIRLRGGAILCGAIAGVHYTAMDGLLVGAPEAHAPAATGVAPQAKDAPQDCW